MGSRNNDRLAVLASGRDGTIARVSDIGTQTAGAPVDEVLRRCPCGCPGKPPDQ